MRKLGRGLDSLIPIDSGAQTAPETSVPTDLVTVNPEQPRRQFDSDALEELAESVKEHGIIQPLVLTKTADGYELLAGQRRLEAAKMVGLTRVPAIIRSATQQQKLEVAIIENVQRRDLNPLEQAIAYRRLMDEFSLTQEQVSKRVGKARASVGNTVRLLQLSEPIQQALLQEKITEGHARALLAVDESRRHEAFEKVLAQNLTVRETEQLSKTEADPVHSSQSGHTKSDSSHRFTAIEEALRSKFATKVAVTTRGRRGVIAIEFFSREELERILQDLGVEFTE